MIRSNESLLVGQFYTNKALNHKFEIETNDLVLELELDFDKQTG